MRFNGNISGKFWGFLCGSVSPECTCLFFGLGPLDILMSMMIIISKLLVLWQTEQCFLGLYHSMSFYWLPLRWPRHPPKLRSFESQVVPTSEKHLSTQYRNWSSVMQSAAAAKAMCKLHHGNKWHSAVVLETLRDSKVRVHVQLPWFCWYKYLGAQGTLQYQWWAPTY